MTAELSTLALFFICFICEDGEETPDDGNDDTGWRSGFATWLQPVLMPSLSPTDASCRYHPSETKKIAHVVHSFKAVRPHMEWLIFYSNCPIVWHSKLQTTISLPIALLIQRIQLLWEKSERKRIAAKKCSRSFRGEPACLMIDENAFLNFGSYSNALRLCGAPHFTKFLPK